jgi:hypothetical protein
MRALSLRDRDKPRGLLRARLARRLLHCSERAN